MPTFTSVSAEALEVEAGSLSIRKAALDAVAFVISHPNLKGSPFFSWDGALWFSQLWSHHRVGGGRWGWCFGLNFLGNLGSGSIKTRVFFSLPHHPQDSISCRCGISTSSHFGLGLWTMPWEGSALCLSSFCTSPAETMTFFALALWAGSFPSYLVSWSGN